MEIINIPNTKRVSQVSKWSNIKDEKALDLLIITPRMLWFNDRSMISIGSLGLASFLHEKGYKVKVIDDNSIYKKYTLKNLINYINQHSPKIIGFSMSTLNAYSGYELAKKVLEQIKEAINQNNP